jgi:hypothetical protein
MAQDKLREESHDFNGVRPFTSFRVTTSRSFSTAWEVLKWNHRILYLGIFQSAICNLKFEI